jgi:hypothetical protein
MADIEQLYESIANSDLWTDVGPSFVGFLAPLAAMSLIEENTSLDTYDELYGLLTIALSEVVAGGYKREVQVGAGLYAVNQIAERFGVQDRIVALGTEV